LKTIFSVLVFAIWITLIVLFIQYSTNSKQPEPTIINVQTFKISANANIKSYLQKLLDKIQAENSNLKFEFVQQNETPEIIFETKQKNLPDNFEKIELIKKEVTLEPKIFAINLADRIPDFSIWLGWQKDKNINTIKEKLQKLLHDELENEISLTAVGDIMLGRYVGKKIDDNSPDYPFAKIQSQINQNDITFGNLESPFNDREESGLESMIFNAKPEAIKGLVNAGFDVLNFANNHCGDQGKDGVNFTLKLLADNSIKVFGAGSNWQSAHQPQVIESKGWKIAFLGYSDSGITPKEYSAKENSSGCNLMNSEQLQKDIEQAKTQADFIIVSMHAGNEYQPKPTPTQINFAHQAIDDGADVVVGHHPHVAQPVEIYQNKFIFYSLGNFVFDQSWSKETKQGLVLDFKLLFNQVSFAKLVPVHIENSQVTLADAKESAEILNRVFTND